MMMPVLTVDYDVIFQLNHIYRHLIDEGVGLRQVLDYYMLLRTWHHDKGMEKNELLCHVRGLGMLRFASALMFVLKEVFAFWRRFFNRGISAIMILGWLNWMCGKVKLHIKSVGHGGDLFVICISSPAIQQR